MKKTNHRAGHATTSKRAGDYGIRGWVSEDKLFNEFDLRSNAIAYAGVEGGRDEFFSFYQQIAPAEVLERVWKHVHG